VHLWLIQDSILPYANVMIFKEVMEKSGSTDGRKVADAIRAFDLRDGSTKYYPGCHLQFDPRRRRVDAGLVIIQWQGGKALAVFPPDVATAEATWTKV
jgi:branched-chain amino acid transport system substrate-binding protein